MPRTPTLESGDVSLDEFGLLRRNGKWVALPNAERKVMAELLASIDHVVPTSQFYETIWPTRSPPVRGRPLNVLVCRLRKRIGHLDLAITTIRAEGFLLHRVDV